MLGKTATATWVALVLGAALAPAPAAASTRGSTTTPEARPGKEYAIPLVEGRAEGPVPRNQRRAADIPFGVGINPPGRGGGATPRAGRAVWSARRGRGKGRSEPQVPRRGPKTGGTAGRTLLIALAVMGPAALLAVLLQARRPVESGGSAA